MNESVAAQLCASANGKQCTSQDLHSNWKTLGRSQSARPQHQLIINSSGSGRGSCLVQHGSGAAA